MFFGSMLKKALELVLKPALNDNTLCEIDESSPSTAEQDDATTVADAARVTLDSIKTDQRISP